MVHTSNPTTWEVELHSERLHLGKGGLHPQKEKKTWDIAQLVVCPAGMKPWV